MKVKDYPVLVFYNECYIAIAPDLLGCSAGGDTPTQAIDELQIAIELWLDAAAKMGNPIPTPTYPDYRLTHVESVPEGLSL